MQFISKYKFQIIAFLLIVFALMNCCHLSALKFIKGVAEKNLVFLSLVADIKLILACVQDVHIPFISGGSQEVNSSLANAEKYLLIVNVITVTQLMLITISKSVVVKVILLILFIGSLIPQTKTLASKLLVIALVLNPGLTLFTKGMEYVSQEAKFDFGDKYAVQLKAQVYALKNEQAQLMQEHHKQLTILENAGHKSTFFQRVKEDVSYDFKALKLNLDGDYLHLRSLFQEAGKEMLRKLMNFCTMIIFCLLLMPIVYALVVYVVYNQLFPKSPLSLSAINGMVKKVESNLKNPAEFAKQEESKIKEQLTSVSKNFESHVQIHNELSEQVNRLKEKITQLENGKIAIPQPKEGITEPIIASIQAETQTVKNELENFAIHEEKTAVNDAKVVLENVENSLRIHPIIKI